MESNAFGERPHASVVILATGSREFADYALVERELDAMVKWLDVKSGDTVTIVHGGARGLDKLAGQYARARGYVEKCMPARWRNQYGQIDYAAGPRRNQEMIDETNPHAAVCFPLGESKGTRDCISRLEAHQKTRRSRLCLIRIVESA